MKLVGWIFDKGIFPWTKVFDLSVEPNFHFGNTEFELLTKHLVECDLAGVVNLSGTDDLGFIDGLFRVFGCNLKDCYYDKTNVLFDGKPIYSDSHYGEVGKDHKVAQCTLIDGKYIYFNMTSYGFWNNIEKFIATNFARINLGGELVKLGRYPEIDKQFTDIIS